MLTVKRALASVAAAAIVLAAPSVAHAHATLVRSEPAEGAVLERAPALVRLRFSEPVEIELGAVRVLDADLRRVDEGRVVQPSSSVVEVPLRRLARGTYVVTWRIVSADTHPVGGAFTFSVGAASSSSAEIRGRALRTQAAPEYVEALFGVVRFASFLLLLLSVGGSIHLGVSGERDPRQYRFLAGFAASLGLVSAFGLVCQGAEATALGLREGFDTAVLGEVLDSRFGDAWATRAIFAFVLAALALLGRSARWFLPAVGAVLLPTTSLASHARVEGSFTVAVDLAHTLAAAVWVGGLAFVLLALVSAGEGTTRSVAARIVPRFSRTALASVALLVVAGIVNAYLEIRSFRALFHSAYGQLVLVKSAVLLPVLALGAYNNRFVVPRLRDDLAPPAEPQRLVRAITGELALLAVIVGVTAILVAEPPGKAATAAAPGAPVKGIRHVGPYRLDLTVEPAQVGPNVVHVDVLDHVGVPSRADEVRIAASLPGSDIGRLRFAPRRTGFGRYVVSRAVLPVAGDWVFRVDVRRGEFDQWSAVYDVPVRR